MNPFFIKEDFREGHRGIADTAKSFMDVEVYPLRDRIDAGEGSLVPRLLRRAGELGLLRSDLGMVESAIVAENVAHQGSFSVAVIGHTGIGTLPLAMYGNEDQKARFLSKMASGELIGAFALTERNTGSDALSVETRAELSRDGKSYTLGGEKVYCTSGDIAGLFTVFASVEGGGLAAFLVEKGAAGFTVGGREKKMGLGGSAAVSLEFSNVCVPSENLLDEVGRGHKIALNALNIGRFKLGASCIGNSKHLIGEMARCAKSRRRFGRPISDFELIRHKLARSACRVYMLESLVYRLAGDMDAALASESPAGISEMYAVESAIAKVYGSETIAYVSDEAVQLFGGEGYMRGNAAERAYRDFRVDRIFEGTNEINRLFISGTLMKRAVEGKLPGWIAPDVSEDGLSNQVACLKRAAVNVAATAVKNLGDSLMRRQAVLSNIADLAIEIYAIESGLGRALKVGDEHYRCICEVVIAKRVPPLLDLVRQTMINIGGGPDKIDVCKPLAVDTDALYGRITGRILNTGSRDAKKGDSLPLCFLASLLPD